MKQISWIMVVLLTSAVQAQTQIGFKQKGHASYYADKFQGRKTANGEKYNGKELTAAHRKLPFNSILKITNTRNGKEVLVRVNDRGPWNNRFDIDLSRAAANQLDMVKAGTVPVTIEVVGVDGIVTTAPEEKPSRAVEPLASRRIEPKPKTVLVSTHAALDDRFHAGQHYSLWGTPKSPQGFGVQIGSYTELEHARDLCRELIAKKQDAVFIKVEGNQSGNLYQVLAGAFGERKEAQHYLKTLQQSGFDGFVKPHSIE